MSDAFTVRFAGLDSGVESRYDFMRRFCRDYLADGEPSFFVRADEAAVRKTAELVCGLCAQPCRELSCDISKEAVRVSFEALTGRRFRRKT